MKALLLVVAALTVALSGCATTRGDAPTNSTEALTQIAVQGAITVAVDRVVTRDNATPADAEIRATRIVNVATALRDIGADKLSSLAQINAVVAPLLDRLDLTPVERNQANLLVSALVSVALERSNVKDYVTQVAFILDEVIRDAGAYISEPAHT